MPTTVRLPIDLRNPRFTTLAGNSFVSGRSMTAWDAMEWHFADAAEGHVYGVVPIPQNMNATPNASIVLMTAYNATTGVCRWGLATKAVADAESFNPATFTAETQQNITVPATAFIRKDVTFTLTEALAAGDLLLVDIARYGAHANDTLTSDGLVLEALLQIDVG